MPRRPAPPVPEYLSWLKDPEYQVRFLDQQGHVHWESNPGPQTWFLLCPFDEILFGGQRGGGKSQGLIAWFAMGDPSLPKTDPAHTSYLNDPSFRGLMLREEYQSMAEFVDEAMDFYRIFDCKAMDDPTVFHFKSGAKIYTNHLGSKDAYNKYKGWNITKIGLEELTQIPDQRWYLKLLGSLRAKGGASSMKWGHVSRKLRTQMASTTNPDGPGAIWVKNRFVKVLDGKGVLIPRNRGMRDEITGLTRIFIPATLDDNPYLREDQKYIGGLKAQDEVLQAQWLHGDWDAGTGTYFRDYRPDGPLGSEEQEKYPWAHHRTEGVQLASWWTRWGGGDIGYDHPACFHKFCRNDRDKRVHVYDELWLRHVGSYELGVTLAQWWTPELTASETHQITLYLSPDAFAKRDETKTLAEQIESGIKAVLGPYGAFVLKYSEDERKAAERDPKIADALFARRRDQMTARGQFCITLKMANNNRVHGFSYIKDLLRFRPVLSETEEEMKERLRLLYTTAGMEAYERELSSSKERKAEILPGLLIWKVCKQLDRCMREAQKDADHNPEDVLAFNAVDGVGGDDPLDACFVAGTLVETEFGKKPIEDVQIGDRVWTRSGLGTVTASACTGFEETIKVKILSGACLQGTRNHPIYTKKSGFVRLDSLRYGSMVETWLSARRSYLTGSSSGVIQNPSIGICGHISGLEEITARTESARFIRKYGLRLTVRYRKILTSITKTAIRSIMSLPTWNAWPLLSTCCSTGIQQKPQRACGWSKNSESMVPGHGINQKKAETGTEKMASGLFPKDSPSNQYASNVEQPTGQSAPAAQDSAATPAGPRIGAMRESITQSSFVRVAIKSLAHVASIVRSTVLDRVVSVQPSGKEYVYNLAVSPSHEYFANGILVHNCRYGAMGYKDILSRMPKSAWVSEQMAEIQAKNQEAFGHEIKDPTRLAMIAACQNKRYEKANPMLAGGQLTLPRESNGRHRVQ